MTSNMNTSMGMSMTFHTGYTDPILLEGWVANNVIEFILTCVFFFAMAAMFEGLKYFRELLYQVAFQKRKERKGKLQKPNLQDNDSEVSSLIDVSKSRSSRIKKLCCPNMSLEEHGLHILQVFLHMVQVAVGYILMLVVMTYNLWLFFAVVFGFGLGYLIFGRMRIINGHQSGDEDPCCN